MRVSEACKVTMKSIRTILTACFATALLLTSQANGITENDMKKKWKISDGTSCRSIDATGGKGSEGNFCDPLLQTCTDATILDLGENSKNADVGYVSVDNPDGDGRFCFFVKFNGDSPTTDGDTVLNVGSTNECTSNDPTTDETVTVGEECSTAKPGTVRATLFTSMAVLLLCVYQLTF
eukprot:gb/GECG01000018.1/.p1 GENE.gb/GECG01000018.1/~~gb/GECG01000018.1/.p1  ORF type:complete len:179 (+),score=23.17 gb/GECG01000018.1/:1-537(+)